MKKFLKKQRKIILFLILTILFFSCSPVLTWDSAHYLSYVEIFEGVKPFSSWDIVRGPIFPVIIHLSNLIFGKTTQGILLCMFLFYLLFIYLVFQICNIIFKKMKNGHYLKYIITAISVFNPVIFGYYHVLLIEFVAITLSLLSCYIAYKWWSVDSRKNRLFYSLYFILAISFSWFLKQPYICCTLIPMTISYIIALFKRHDKKNIIYYTSTVLTSVIVLIISLISWNQFLEYKGVDMETGRNSSTMMARQMIQGVQYYTLEDINENYQEDVYFSKQEKEYIKNSIDQNKSIKVITISNHNKIIDKDVIDVDTHGYPSSLNVIFQVSSTFFKYPTIILKNYIKNYCALSSICVITSSDGVMYSVTNDYDFFNLFENSLIAYKPFKEGSNRFYMTDEMQLRISNYTQINSSSIPSKLIGILQIPTSILYKLVYIILPIALIGIIVMKFINQRKIVNDNLYTLSCILLSYSFLAMIANGLSGSLIDRYSAAMFIPSFLGIIAAGVFIIENLRKQERKEILKKEKRKQKI